ncbi:MAG: hypothetical protein IJH88_07345 [Eggerthellaceae bacterium]|nr:hypothetical protein [Eggerthellaceae bacterium]
MKKLVATAALASFLVLAGCAQGTASPSAGTSPASVSSAATSSQSPDASDASAGQPQAPSAETPAASSAASAESGASPQSGAASAEHVDSFAIGVGDTQLVATLADTDAARALAQRLQAGPVTVSLHAYGGFEKVGPLPWPLPASDEQITTQPGDVMLYQGNQITVFTGSNSWAYTRLGHIEGATSESLLEALGDGDVEISLSLV